MDTMLSFHTDNLSNAMTKEQIKAVCPLAFYDEPTNPGVSNKYMMANTETIIDDMARLGWYPVEAKQCRAKKGSKGIRSFHMIAFQNEEVKIMQDGETEAYPRIILTNSHDGFRSFKFMCGIYRLICSNGLVIATEEFANISIRHINYTFEELRKVVAQAIDAIPEQVKVMNKMKQTELTDEQKYDLALRVLKARKGVEEDDKFTATKDSLDDMLAPVRTEDAGNDLWTVFNVLQEKAIKGGYSYASDETKKPRKQRSIKSAVKDISLNQTMFAIATSFLPATVAA